MREQIPPITALRSFLQVLQTFSECFQHHLKNPFEFRNKDNLVVEFLMSCTNPTYHLEHRYLGLALYISKCTCFFYNFWNLLSCSVQFMKHGFMFSTNSISLQFWPHPIVRLWGWFLRFFKPLLNAFTEPFRVQWEPGTFDYGLYTANVCRDLRGVYREIRVRGFQIYGDCM